jgi:hypothetical protein
MDNETSRTEPPTENKCPRCGTPAPPEAERCPVCKTRFSGWRQTLTFAGETKLCVLQGSRLRRPLGLTFTDRRLLEYNDDDPLDSKLLAGDIVKAVVSVGTFGKSSYQKRLNHFVTRTIEETLSEHPECVSYDYESIESITIEVKKTWGEVPNTRAKSG